MTVFIFGLLAVGALLVGLGLNPFLETLARRKQAAQQDNPHMQHEQRLAPERTGTITFPSGIGMMVFALALSVIWGGSDGLRAFGGMLQFIALFFLGRWLFLRFSTGLGDRLNQKIMAEKLNRKDERDPYALSYHHQMRFVSGFFSLIGFGALLFLLGLLLEMIGSS